MYLPYILLFLPVTYVYDINKIINKYVEMLIHLYVYVK